MVGASAAAVHFLVVTLMVAVYGWRPIIANVVAFCVAFFVSYTGHSLLTFADRDAAHSQSAPRFLAVAVTGFVSNELLYYLALNVLHLPYQPALVLVLVMVAGMTYVLSHLWAFRGQGSHE